MDRDANNKQLQVQNQNQKKSKKQQSNKANNMSPSTQDASKESAPLNQKDIIVEPQTPTSQESEIGSAVSRQSYLDTGNEFEEDVDLDLPAIRNVPAAGVSKRTKVWKQKMFHECSKQCPELADKAKTMATIKANLRASQSRLKAIYAYCSGTHTAVRTYMLTVEESSSELQIALDRLDAYVKKVGEVTMFSSPVEKIDLLLEDKETLTHYRHSMDRLKRKTVKLDSDSKKWRKSMEDKQSAELQYEMLLAKVKADMDLIQEKVKLSHPCFESWAPYVFHVLHALRKMLVKNRTPEGSALYKKSWKSFSTKVGSV
mmetsp:Transcript_4621/g.10095  ORF Transcript_4621/g.10095 Transcript_4621/m.10095 type:complete len:315 (-) Transcript_4621:1655-2599(-)